MANALKEIEHAQWLCDRGDITIGEYFDLVKKWEDAEPVKRGRWIKNEGRSGWHCSCCGKDDLYAYPYKENNERELQDFYCPNCGAKMNEQQEVE